MSCNAARLGFVITLLVVLSEIGRISKSTKTLRFHFLPISTQRELTRSCSILGSAVRLFTDSDYQERLKTKISA